MASNIPIHWSLGLPLAKWRERWLAELSKFDKTTSLSGRRDLRILASLAD